MQAATGQPAPSQALECSGIVIYRVTVRCWRAWIRSPFMSRLNSSSIFNGNLPAGTKISKADEALIEARAHDTDPSHWLSVKEFSERIRANFE